MFFSEKPPLALSMPHFLSDLIPAHASVTTWSIHYKSQLRLSPLTSVPYLWFFLFLVTPQPTWEESQNLGLFVTCHPGHVVPLIVHREFSPDPVTLGRPLELGISLSFQRPSTGWLDALLSFVLHVSPDDFSYIHFLIQCETCSCGVASKVKIKLLSKLGEIHLCIR